MDVLYFLKEEYDYVRSDVRILLGGDTLLAEGDLLRRFLKQVELIVRIADELILPELAERARKGFEVLALAGDQTSLLGKLADSGIRSGRLGDARRKELATLLGAHVEHMEQHILPKFREEIPTQAREDLGVVAQDYKTELHETSSGQRSPKVADSRKDKTVIA